MSASTPMIKTMLRRLVLLTGGFIGLSVVAFVATDMLLPEDQANEPPVLVRFGRWLACASPIKIGERPQVLPDGRIVREPGPLDEPLIWQWFRAGPPGPVPGTSPVTAADSRERRQEAFKAAAALYLRAAKDFAQENKTFESMLCDYARETHIKNAVDEKGHIIPEMLVELRPNTALSSWPPLVAEADKAYESAVAAQQARCDLIAVLRTRPFPESGVPIIPGVLGLAPPDLGWSTRLGCPVVRACLLGLLLTLGMSVAAGFLSLPARALESHRMGRTFGRWLCWPIALGAAVAVSTLLGRELRLFPQFGLHSADAASMPLWPSPAQGGGLERGLVLDLLWHLCMPVACLTAAACAIRLRSERPTTPLSPQARSCFCALIWPLFWIAMPVECVFSLPGLGGLAWKATVMQERDLVIGAAVVIGASGLILNGVVGLARRRASK